MTGHQDHAATGKTLQGELTYAINIYYLCKAMGIENVYEIDAFDIEGLEKLLKQETQRDALSVIITKSPCALLKEFAFCMKMPARSADSAWFRDARLW